MEPATQTLACAGAILVGLLEIALSSFATTIVLGMVLALRDSVRVKMGTVETIAAFFRA